MGNRYKGLRILAVSFQVLAWAILVLGATAGLAVLVGVNASTPKGMGAAILGVSAIYFCLLSALSGILNLLLVLEERSRLSE